MAGTCAGDNAKLVRKTSSFNQSGSIWRACMERQICFLEYSIGIEILDLLRCFSMALVEF